jgi:hypothetical protein
MLADENQNALSLAETQSSQRKARYIVDRIREDIILPTLSAPDGAKIMQK